MILTCRDTPLGLHNLLENSERVSSSSLPLLSTDLLTRMHIYVRIIQCVLNKTRGIRVHAVVVRSVLRTMGNSRSGERTLKPCAYNAINPSVSFSSISKGSRIGRANCFLLAVLYIGMCRCNVRSIVRFSRR